MRKSNFNIFLFACVASVNLISISVGNAFTWSSPVLPKLYTNNTDINPLGRPITVLEESWLSSLISLGATLGAIFSSTLAGKYGRKRTILVFSVAIFIANMLIAFGHSIEIYLFARLLIGIGIGSVFASLPSFVAEISEDMNRGLMGSFMGVSLCIGAMISYVIGPFVTVRTLNIIHIIPLCLFYPLVLIMVPESPYYYVTYSDEHSAGHSLKRLRLTSMGTQKKELVHIKEFLDEQRNNKPSLKVLFKTKTLTRGLGISCGLMVIQQFSGITPIAGFLEYIFEESGSSLKAHNAVILVAFIQLLANMSSGYFVDRLGRKMLLLISTVGDSISMACLGIFFHLKIIGYDVTNITWVPIASLMMYLVSFNLGLGPLPWTIVGEIFSSNVKSLASCLTCVVSLGFAFVITLMFPYMMQWWGMAWTFWFFSTCCAIGVCFTTMMVPETKGKSLKEIQELLM